MSLSSCSLHSSKVDRQTHLDRHKIKRLADWNMCCDSYKLGSGGEMDGREKATSDSMSRGSLWVEVVFQWSPTGRQEDRPGMHGVEPTIPSGKEHVQRP